jgi:hypothetical protein
MEVLSVDAVDGRVWRGVVKMGRRKGARLNRTPRSLTSPVRKHKGPCSCMQSLDLINCF